MIELRNLILNTIKIIKERPRKPLTNQADYYDELEDWLKNTDGIEYLINACIMVETR